MAGKQTITLPPAVLVPDQAGGQVQVQSGCVAGSWFGPVKV